MSEQFGVEVWRGGVNTWQCDAMGHLNVRFYVAYALEGLVCAAAELGLSDAFKPGAATTLIVREHHIRFVREARPSSPLYMTCAVVEWGETHARLLQILRHSGSGETCATYLTRVVHADAVTGQPTPWPKDAHARAEALTAEIPDFAAPRSVPSDEVRSDASMERAEAMNLTRLGMGAFKAQDCDVFGRLIADAVMGRISDGVPVLVSGARATMVDLGEGRTRRVGGAVLEMRLMYHQLPRAGDRFVLRSGFGGANHRGEWLVHWMMDPVTGKPWATAHAYVINMDLDARKIIALDEAQQAALNAKSPPGLAP